MEKQTQALTLTQRAQAIDVISSRALEAFTSAESFEKELTVAQAIIDMREALTLEVMQPVMGLMNTSLGFRTDKDPAQLDKFGKPNVPYTMEVVREAFIESRLRGFHACGNEWNIIAGRWYGCVAGFERLVKKHPKVTDFKDHYGVPTLHGDKGAIVKARAEWRQDGTQQTLERDFAIRVNSGMGADAIIGKAKRKLFAAVYARLTGVVTPEGEAGEEAINVTATVSQTVDAASMFRKPAATAANPATPEPAKEEVKPEPATAASAPAPEKTVQEQLAEVVTGAGYTFDQFLKWARETGAMSKPQCDDCQGFADVSENQARRFKNAKGGLLQGLAKAAGKV